MTTTPDVLQHDSTRLRLARVILIITRPCCCPVPLNEPPFARSPPRLCLITCSKPPVDRCLQNSVRLSVWPVHVPLTGWSCTHALANYVQYTGYHYHYFPGHDLSTDYCWRQFCRKGKVIHAKWVPRSSFETHTHMCACGVHGRTGCAACGEDVVVCTADQCLVFFPLLVSQSRLAWAPSTVRTLFCYSSHILSDFPGIISQALNLPTAVDKILILAG